MPTPPDPTVSVVELSEDEVYALYENLQETIQAQIYATTDLDALPALENASQALTDLLDNKDSVHIEANTALFTALTPKMKATNDTLSAVKAQLDAIAGKFAEAAKITSAIAKVLTATAKYV